MVKVSSGKFLPSNKQIKGNVPVYGGNGITGWHNCSSVNKSTIVFGRVGDYCGSVHFASKKSWITDNAIFIKKIIDEINIEYLFRYLSRLNINLLAEVTGQPKITQGILDNLIIHYPENKKEQEKIASHLFNIDNLINLYSQVITTTKNLKKGLAQQLLTKGIGHKRFQTIRGFFGKEITLPEEWIFEKLGNVAKLQPGYSFKSKDFTLDGIKLLKIANVSHGKIIWHEQSYVPSTYWEKYVDFQLKNDDIVFAMTRPIISTGLKIAFFNHNKKILLNQRVGRFIILDIDKEFLYYFLNESRFFNQIKIRISESNQPNISSDEVELIPITYPSNKKEQIEIASILKTLDSKILNLESKKNNLENLKKGIMQKLLTGKILVKV